MTGRRVTARRDEGLRARVVRRMPLLYAPGADATLDRPAHVRSGSGLAWIGGVLAAVQDDARFVARIDPRTGLSHPLTLPAGPGGLRQFDDLRGNKRHKLDLESCAAVPDGDGGVRLVAFGSGSTPRRQQVLHVDGLESAHPRVELCEAAEFYHLLRQAHAFAGSELNLEGAVWREGRLVLLNRGNGAPADGREPVDATCEVDWPVLRAHLAGAGPPPGPDTIIRYDLGEIEGCRLTFTDAAVVGGALVYTAAAEASPNAVDDGPVAGSAVGLIAPDGEARWTELRRADGTRFMEKVEGVANGSRAGTLYVVLDPDEPRRPSELCEVELAGDWPS